MSISCSCGRETAMKLLGLNMYDKPKAIHFNAFKDGEKLADLHPVGLEARWAVARKCREASIDMLLIGFKERRLIVGACAEFNNARDDGLVVQFQEI